MSLASQIDLLATRIGQEIKDVRTEFAPTVVLTVTQFAALTPPNATTIYLVIPD